MGDAFFDGKAEAARLKHLILRKYLPPFISKVGYTATYGRVVIVDGYAGPGRYEDGSEGSPLILSGFAANPPGGGDRKVDVVLVEKEVTHYKLLRNLLAEHPVAGVRSPIHGRVTDHLDDILASADAQPLFAYLDPYGLDVAWTDLTNKIFARPGTRYAPATEILLNLSADGIRRIGGVLEAAPYSGRRKTLERLDIAVGGDWWRDEWRLADSPGEAAEVIASEYARRLSEASNAYTWAVPVVRKEGQQPVYHLVYATRHPDGQSVFGETVSGALGEWRKAQMEGTLFESEFAETEKTLGAEWSRTIAHNVTALLGTRSTIALREHYAELFGSVLGRAREKHLRAALKQLAVDGVIAEAPTGKLVTGGSVVIRRA